MCFLNLFLLFLFFNLLNPLYFDCLFKCIMLSFALFVLCFYVWYKSALPYSRQKNQLLAFRIPNIAKVTWYPHITKVFLTWMGSWVSLIGPTHSSVAETCNRWADTWVTVTKQTHKNRHKANNSYHFTIDVQNHICRLFFSCTTCLSLLHFTTFKLLFYIPCSLLGVHAAIRQSISP